uniref:Hsp70binding protein 1like [Nasonia vitripennis] n=1 Tax=Lepeophtheirus salmonis TaxID=72036 RepID=A0A0K2TCU5_LEPSM
MSNRQPRDLRGLLKFCAEYTKTEDAPSDSGAEPIDPERIEFLQNVLKNLSVDVIKEFTKAIEILIDRKVSDPNVSDVSEQIYAMECIEDWVGQIDMAINFHKVGGFEALLNTLKCPHDSLKSQSAHLIAELTQNNPYCQTHMAEDGFLHLLLELLDSSDSSDSVRVKVLYAISCIIRQCPESQDQWISLDGPSILIRALMDHVSKLKIKASFLMSALIQENPSKFARLFSSMGTHIQLAALIVQDTSNEQVAMALHTLLKHSEDSSVLSDITENPELMSTLSKNVKSMAKREECNEERDYYIKILDMCFGKPEGLDR